MTKQKTITYSQVGDNYDTKDPIKKLAQLAATQTIIKEKSAQKNRLAFFISFYF